MRAIPLWIKILAPLALLVIASGFLHVVRGDSVGLTLCAKDGWALQHTFVNVDDYKDQSPITMPDKAAVIRALVSCGAMETPAQIQERFYGALMSAMENCGASLDREKSIGLSLVIHAPEDGCDRLQTLVPSLPASPLGLSIACGNMAKGRQWNAVERNRKIEMR